MGYTTGYSSLMTSLTLANRDRLATAKCAFAQNGGHFTQTCYTLENLQNVTPDYKYCAEHDAMT